MSKKKQIALNYGEPIPSIIFSFAKQVGMLPLTGTSNQEHMNQDLSGIDIKLTNEEIHLVQAISNI